MTKFVSSRCAEPLLLLGALALTAVPSARADLSDWRFQGYASQRLTATSGDNQFFGDTAGKLSADYRELAAGFSWRPHADWLLSGQAVHRAGGDSIEEDLETDYLFVSWSPLDLNDGNLVLRAGKIKVPYGLYNEGRDTPMTRPGILPPQSIYLDAMRGFNQSAFGLHLGSTWEWETGALSLDLSQIKPNVDEQNVYLFFVGDNVLFNGQLETRSNQAYSARLAYEHQGGRLKAVYSHAQGRARYIPGPGDLWQGGKITPSFSTLSCNGTGTRLLTWEHSRNLFRNRYDGQPPFIPDVKLRSVGSSDYLQAEWRITPRWTGLLRHDRLYLDDDDKDGRDFAATTPGKPAYMRYAKDWMIGLRYRPDDHWLLAGEIHHVDGIAWLPPADNLSGDIWDPASTDRRWNLFLLQATYQF